MGAGAPPTVKVGPPRTLKVINNPFLLSNYTILPIVSPYQPYVCGGEKSLSCFLVIDGPNRGRGCGDERRGCLKKSLDEVDREDALQIAVLTFYC